MILRTLFSFLVLILFYSCNSEQTITDKEKYNTYLSTHLDSTKLFADADFWNTKINPELKQFSVMASRASAYTQVFDATGNIDFLIKAEKDLIESNILTNYNNAGALRSLAANYISQHRFKEALELLKKAEVNGEKLNATKKMLFDVHLELGNYIYAESYLNEIKNPSSFDYLIRLAKWEDHKGNLDGAIENMEKATAIAESSNLDASKKWSYTNLADFYGHAGRIQDSYNHYLKALELDENDAYSKKGIAWIVYSHENNPEEALRILDHVSSYYASPDYDLLKADIAETMNNNQLKTQSLKKYKTEVDKVQYGEMYNKYNVLLYAEAKDKLDEAIQIAKREVENRPTPQSYDLLAWSYFKNGEVKKANTIINEHVYGKTSEPDVLYHIAEIYKAAGKTEEIKPLKQELMASLYELGPTMTKKIERL